MTEKAGTAAIITAAGASERFGEDKNAKLLLGVPSIVHTLRAFEKSAQTVQTVVVTRKEKIDFILSLKETYGFRKLTAVVEGGSCRQESAARGFAATDPSLPFIAVHDGARPLITPEDIDTVALEAYRHGAAIAAMRQTSTVKLVNGGFIARTVDRNTLLSAATPQIFSREIYGKMLEAFSERLGDFTDDSSMAEELGIKVKAVICDPTNIKITEPGDYTVAEAILLKKTGHIG